MMEQDPGAFSSFAEMPAQQNETLNVVKTVKLALDIFDANYIPFYLRGRRNNCEIRQDTIDTGSNQSCEECHSGSSGSGFTQDLGFVVSDGAYVRIFGGR